MMVNVGLEGFVCVVVCELLCGICINFISFIVFSELLVVYGDFFSGFFSVFVVVVVQVYCCSIEGVQIGCIYLVGYQFVLVCWGWCLYQVVVVGILMVDCFWLKN